MKAYYLFSALSIIVLFSGYGCSGAPEQTTPPYLDILDDTGTNSNSTIPINAQASSNQATNSNATNESTNYEEIESSPGTPSVQVHAEHYVTEYNLSAITVTLTPLDTAGQELKKVAVEFPPPVTSPPYAQDANVNLEGAAGWTCTADSLYGKPFVQCIGGIVMREGKKSVFTFFFQKNYLGLGDIPIEVSIPYGDEVLKIPITIQP